MNKTQKKKRTAVKILLTVLAVIVLILAAAGGYFYLVRGIGRSKLQAASAAEAQPTANMAQSAPPKENAHEDGTVALADLYHGGKAYNYRDDLINILFIGVDKSSYQNKTAQADALYLAVIDEKNSAVNVIALSRSSMAEVMVYSKAGDFVGTSEMQICLAYGYETDDEKASELTARAVSRLLYDIPLSGYYTVFFDGVPKLVDSVGDVSIELRQDLSAEFPGMYEGTEMKLDASNVMQFLRARSADDNNGRMSRQVQFLKSFAAKAKSAVADRPTALLDMYQSISAMSVTNLSYESIVYLLSLVPGLNIGQFYTVKGTTDSYNGSEAVYIDDAALYDLLLSVFYEEA